MIIGEVVAIIDNNTWKVSGRKEYADLINGILGMKTPGVLRASGMTDEHKELYIDAFVLMDDNDDITKYINLKHELLWHHGLRTNFISDKEGSTKKSRSY